MSTFLIFALFLVLVIYGLLKPAKPVPVVMNTSKLEQEIGSLKTQLTLSKASNVEISTVLLNLQKDYEKLQHQKKSSEVRTGFLGEALLPLHEDFPVDPKTMRFLGSPIDYISFSYETNTITFLEIKTGDSQLNENQRAVKKMVEDGRVEFKIVRLNEKGMKVK